MTITETILREMLGADYDPWPGLDVAELRFLIGDRLSRNACPQALRRCVVLGGPIGLIEKLIAADHREWLEAGADKKRKKLAKAQAEIAKLTGKTI